MWMNTAGTYDTSVSVTWFLIDVMRQYLSCTNCLLTVCGRGSLTYCYRPTWLSSRQVKVLPYVFIEQMDNIVLSRWDWEKIPRTLPFICLDMPMCESLEGWALSGASEQFWHNVLSVSSSDSCITGNRNPVTSVEVRHLSYNKRVLRNWKMHVLWLSCLKDWECGGNWLIYVIVYMLKNSGQNNSWTNFSALTVGKTNSSLYHSC